MLDPASGWTSYIKNTYIKYNTFGVNTLFALLEQVSAHSTHLINNDQ